MLAKLARSLTSQSIKPDEWIIVVDSSSDNTVDIISTFCEENDWIRVISVDSFLEPAPRGQRIASLFVLGIESSSVDWDFCSKIDADMQLEKNYFQQIYSKFEQNSSLGIASGNCSIDTFFGRKIESVSNNHTRGGLKTYRRACFDEIKGIEKVDGWDTIDNMKAQMCGWTTSNFKEIIAYHARPTGSQLGSVTTSFNEGQKSYFLGYFPPYLLARALHRMFSSPYIIAGIAMMFGYLSKWVVSESNYDNKDVTNYVRNRQISRLTCGLIDFGKR